MTSGDSLPEERAGPDGSDRPAVDPFEEWLADRGPVRPPLRVAVAFGALLVGWIAGCVVVLGVEGFLVAGSDLDDVLGFALLIGAFAGGAWLVSVLPLALFGNHDGWFFRPAYAPLVGAACGVALLLLEIWVFFGDPPWGVVRGRIDFGAVYLLVVAAVVGGALWTSYTAWMRRRR